jgi:hypothetical protein
MRLRQAADPSQMAQTYVATADTHQRLPLPASVITCQ